MNIEVHEDDDDDDEHQYINNNSYCGDDDDSDDYVYCLSSIFPNTMHRRQPVEYVYNRDSTGKEVSMETNLKLPRNKVAASYGNQRC
jgi:hypothetical protein